MACPRDRAATARQDQAGLATSGIRSECALGASLLQSSASRLMLHQRTFSVYELAARRDFEVRVECQLNVLPRSAGRRGDDPSVRMRTARRRLTF